MTQEQTTLEIDAATMDAWLTQLAEAVARGDIRMVVRDGVAMTCLMPGAVHRATEPRPINPEMAKALIAEAFTRVIAAPPDSI